ncbi:MAG: hypothetical protein WD042_03715 [Phycisphaeraceae bacterium]
MQRHHFLFRRLHSLTGVVPIGAFVAEHLFTSSAILLGAAEYERDIRFIWNLPGLLMMEIFLIWLPIAYHGALGLVYCFTGRPNNSSYPETANWRYTLMRVSGIIALVYIFFHVATTRWRWEFFGWYTPFHADFATITTADALQAHWILPAFFVIGVLATVFHLANGLWTFAITWGITTTLAAQRRWGYICTVIGLVLTLMGLAAILRFSTYQLNEHEQQALTQIKAGQNVDPALAQEIHAGYEHGH